MTSERVDPSLPAELQLTGDIAGVTEARHFVADVVASWGYVPTEALELATSEVVANALLHGRGPVTVSVTPAETSAGEAARVEVRDADPEQLPVTRPVDPTVPGGLGLRILQASADAWGVEVEPAGKVVWFTAPIDDPTPA